ncbi:hypothetical protein JY651_06375 [Pyxidicoccus parkwayensis]|uniref:Uncharacterized protein n=1 Tax=Pyxidicoccus parkwayensis TaxID=2813578 RepID=A0ABX7P0P5_9BACT|nr:hypothetical protein [Pyxidicoccus parkwaysis]QSQ24573.1 hypothetical protein JY651_06375 [Pyxidicoccus parkwaysis]
MFCSLLSGMRAARKIGAADRAQQAGNIEAALHAYVDALAILGARGVDLEAPWCRSAASVALIGYCRAAQELGRKAELLATLLQWRPSVLAWMRTPLTPDEEEHFRWMEQLFHHLTREFSPPVSH